jgi:5'-3' exonuclease
MINILIDGNYIFHKTFGIFGGYGNIDPGKVLKDKSEQSAFIRKVSTDLCSSLKMIPQGGRLVFTADSRSWRKDVEIEDGGYKSGRVKDENVDWSIFFDLMQAFGSHLEKMGFIFSKVEGAEGDDLLMYWSDYFNSKNENCIIITGDKDLHQLAKVSTGAWTAIWNNNSKKNMISVPNGWKETWLEKNESVNIFNMASTISPEKERFKDFLKKVQIEDIQSKPFIFNKILIGDKGDSVPSVWSYEQNGKPVNFTQRKADVVYGAFLESEWCDESFTTLINSAESDEFLNWLSGLVIRTSKGVDSTENRNKVKSNILRNFKLMWLDSSMIPEFVANGCNDEIIRGMSMEKKSVSLDRIKILEGTEWVTAGYQPKGFDPFENFLKS